MQINKRKLSERDICSKFITPALVKARWDLAEQIHQSIQNLDEGTGEPVNFFGEL